MYISKGQVYSLTLVGDGPERQSLEQQARKLGIESQVHFLGYQPKGSAFIPGHKAYLHSALIENLPISLLEAQSCGLPIIAAAVGGIPEIIGDGREGFFWPLDNPETGAQRLIELMTNPSLYESMTEAATVRFKNKFETKAVVRQLVAFWNS
jgi:glycosyltransferase involved in cell wall biosynthesis